MRMDVGLEMKKSKQRSQFLLSACRVIQEKPLPFIEDYRIWQKVKESLNTNRGPSDVSLEEKVRALAVEYCTAIIYFIGSKDARMVKIGYTTALKKRVSALQNSSPVKLEVFASVRYHESLEKLLHDRFSNQRRHGEWFEMDDELGEFVDGVRKSGIEHIINELELESRTEGIGSQGSWVSDRTPKFYEALEDADFVDRYA